MKKATVHLDFSLSITCPSCDHDNDLASFDDAADYHVPIFNNRWDDLVGVVFECSNCERPVEILKVVY